MTDACDYFIIYSMVLVGNTLFLTTVWFLCNRLSIKCLSVLIAQFARIFLITAKTSLPFTADTRFTMNGKFIKYYCFNSNLFEFIPTFYSVWILVFSFLSVFFSGSRQPQQRPVHSVGNRYSSKTSTEPSVRRELQINLSYLYYINRSAPGTLSASCSLTWV